MCTDEILMSSLKGDPVEPFLYLTTQAAKLPSIIRWLLVFFAGTIIGDAKAAKIVTANAGKSVNELQNWIHKRDVYIKEAKKLVSAFEDSLAWSGETSLMSTTNEQLWETNKFDAVICPTQATPALKHGETNQLSVLSLRKALSLALFSPCNRHLTRVRPTGTIQWNVIDSTVGQIPVTFVDPEKDDTTPAWEERRRAAGGSPLIEPRVYGPKGIYNAKDMAGLPVGVQVVGRQWDEERVIELMKVVDIALGPRGFGPGEFAKRQAAAEKVY